nr:GNAT family N-acetyltransferase [Paraglaciecola sp. G1-23]
MDLNQGVAYLNGDSCGYVMWSVSRDELVLVDIAVLPEYQRQGIATELIRHCMQLADFNKKPITLTVTLNNNAIWLYKKMGFEMVDSNDTHYRMCLYLPKLVD